jgi:hypothetical protein
LLFVCLHFSKEPCEIPRERTILIFKNCFEGTNVAFCLKEFGGYIFGDFFELLFILLKEGNDEFPLEIVLNGASGKVFVISNHVLEGLLNAFVGIVRSLDHFWNNGLRDGWRWAKYDV